MKKLTLRLEALEVESFDTARENGSRGTVRGHDTRETEWCSWYDKCGETVDTCANPCDLTPLCPDTEAPVC
ncbi:MAG: hypothetical protein JO306_00030 [Gemmatimonadetes bacterium]|nr:hypothetical protein [Gemmatimonadota bacterium]